MTLTHNKLIMIFCSAALCLSSCSRENGPDNPTEDTNVMSFTAASVETRGTAITTAGEITSMGVFGYSTDTDDFDNTNTAHKPNLLHNKLVKKESNNWTYTPAAYWPMDVSIKNSFFAYAPHSSEFAEESAVKISPNTQSGYPTLTYTISDTLRWQKDILYAVPVLNTNREASSNKVKYHFKHALAWISFVIAPAEYSNPNETYSVNWLSFMADEMPITSTLNLGTGQWSAPTRYEQVVYEFGLTEGAESIKPGETASVIDSDSRLMLFPIEIDGEESGATIDLTFTYDQGLGPAGSEGNETEEYYYYMPFPTTRLSAGRVVVYVINISVDGISLQFHSDNAIEDWIEAEGETVVEIF